MKLQHFHREGGEPVSRFRQADRCPIPCPESVHQTQVFSVLFAFLSLIGASGKTNALSGRTFCI